MVPLLGDDRLALFPTSQEEAEPWAPQPAALITPTPSLLGSPGTPSPDLPSPGSPRGPIWGEALSHSHPPEPCPWSPTMLTCQLHTLTHTATFNLHPLPTAPLPTAPPSQALLCTGHGRQPLKLPGSVCWSQWLRTTHPVGWPSRTGPAPLHQPPHTSLPASLRQAQGIHQLAQAASSPRSCPSLSVMGTQQGPPAVLSPGSACGFPGTGGHPVSPPHPCPHLGPVPLVSRCWCQDTEPRLLLLCPSSAPPLLT